MRGFCSSQRNQNSLDQQSEHVEDFTYACGDGELGNTMLFLNDAIVTLMWGLMQLVS